MRYVVSIVLAVALLVAPAFAAQAEKSASGKTHQFDAEFVSGDAQAKTVTVKGADGNTSTLPVEGKALEAIGTLKAGDQITLTCRDNENGEHQAIVSITKAKAKKGG